MARVYGNPAAAEEILRAGGRADLTDTEAVLAQAADGMDQPGIRLDRCARAGD